MGRPEDQRRAGTVLIATLTGSLEELQQASADWAEQRRVPGFLSEEVLMGEDGRTVVVPVFFESQEAYQHLADDPEQARWWSERMVPHLTDVPWIDGTWQQSLSRVPAMA